MNNHERLTISLILMSIAVLTSIDIYKDYFDGVAGWHIVIESIVALFALSGVFYIIRGQFRLQRSLEKEQQSNAELELEAQKWKQVSKSYIDGLSKEIDKQLSLWELTKAEKDVAFLLLKGLSLKEIALVRYTSVKTTRT